MKVKTLDDLNDEFSSLTKKRLQILFDLDKVSKELIALSEKIYEQSPEYVKINCLRCNGEGVLKNEEGKKVKCDVCGMQKYLWVKKFQDGDTNGDKSS